jgi:DHA3 family macrolide efflux protein-like MFS transporter
VTPFRRLWLAQSVSLLGDFVAVFAVQVAITFRMHGTARDMAGVFIASLIPGILLTPFAGVFADRWDPRRTLIASDLARAVLILLLAFAASLPQMYAISFAVGCVSSFFNPALAITVPLLMPRDRLFAATARLQQSMQLVRIVSPAVAGALAGCWGERACYYADSASFVFSAALLATLRYSRPPVEKRPAAAVSDVVNDGVNDVVREVVGELATGIRFLFGDPKLSFVVLSITLGTFAAGCFGALASLYVRDLLHRGPALLALISSLIGAGTVAGSAVLGGFFRGRDHSFLISTGTTGVGASILLFAAIPTPAAALIGSVGMGLSVALVMAAATALLQGATPTGLRGRVSGASASLASCAQLAAMTLSGACAASLGIRGVFLISAALLFATALTATLRASKLDEIHGAALRQHAP